MNIISKLVINMSVHQPQPEGLHLIQKNKNVSTLSSKGQRGEHWRDSQDNDSEYSWNNEEESYTPNQLKMMDKQDSN